MSNLPICFESLDSKNGKNIEEWLSYSSCSSFVISAKLYGIGGIYNQSRNKLYFTKTNHNISTLIRYLNLDIAKSCVSQLLDEIDKSRTKLSTDKIYVRGEFVMNTRTFTSKYKNLAPNIHSLIINQFTSTINRNIMKDILFIPVEIIIDDSDFQFTPAEQLKYSILPWIKMNITQLNYNSLTVLLEKWIQNSQFMIDGLVITKNINYSHYTIGNPKHSIIFRKDCNIITPLTVTSIDWSLSQWGLLKPLVNIQPMEYLGTVIDKCNGWNAKFISDHKIGPGAKVFCKKKSNNSIPYIDSVIKPCHNYKFPSTTWIGVDIQTEGNQNDNVEIKILLNIFSKLDVKYLNFRNIQKLYHGGFNSFFKIIDCTFFDLEPLFQIEESNRIIQEMTNLKKRSILIPTIVDASGVLGHGLGIKRIRILFASLPTLRMNNWKTKPSLNEVSQIHGFSKKTSEKIIQQYPTMINFLDKCLDHNLQLYSVV